MTVKEHCFQCEDEDNLFEKGKSNHYVIFFSGKELEFCSYECKFDWKEEYIRNEMIEYESEDIWTYLMKKKET